MGKSRERKKSIIFTNYSPGAKNLLCPGKKLGRAAKTTSSVSIGSIWISRKRDLREKLLYIFLDNEGKKLHFFIENISANLFQKWTLYVPRNILGKRNSDNASIIQQFWTFNKKNGLLSKFFGAVVKYAFYVSLGPFWGKTFIEKTVI